MEGRNGKKETSALLLSKIEEKLDFVKSYKKVLPSQRKAENVGE